MVRHKRLRRINLYSLFIYSVVYPSISNGYYIFEAMFFPNSIYSLILGEI